VQQPNARIRLGSLRRSVGCALSSAPIAVGFGVRTGADVRAIANAGADAAIVGGACVACLERMLAAGRDPVAGMRQFLNGLRDPRGVVFDSLSAVDHR
jgi:tryptophan synthase alpha chain